MAKGPPLHLGMHMVPELTQAQEFLMRQEHMDTLIPALAELIRASTAQAIHTLLQDRNESLATHVNGHDSQEVKGFESFITKKSVKRATNILASIYNANPDYTLRHGNELKARVLPKVATMHARQWLNPDDVQAKNELQSIDTEFQLPDEDKVALQPWVYALRKETLGRVKIPGAENVRRLTRAKLISLQRGDIDRYADHFNAHALDPSSLMLLLNKETHPQFAERTRPGFVESTFDAHYYENPDDPDSPRLPSEREETVALLEKAERQEKPEFAIKALVDEKGKLLTTLASYQPAAEPTQDILDFFQRMYRRGFTGNVDWPDGRKKINFREHRAKTAYAAQIISEPGATAFFSEPWAEWLETDYPHIDRIVAFTASSVHTNILDEMDLPESYGNDAGFAYAHAHGFKVIANDNAARGPGLRHKILGVETPVRFRYQVQWVRLKRFKELSRAIYEKTLKKHGLYDHLRRK
jgi:hypothetical protein